MAGEQTVKKDKLYLHIAVMLFLIIGSWFIPATGTVTPVGMRLIGIFVAMLYGWTTVGMLWPSLLGMVALALSGPLTMKEFIAISFGNETIVYIIFIFIFTGVIDEVGLINYIANKIISFKFLSGRPWAFSAFVLIGAYISAAFINMFVSVIVFWAIIYIVAERFEFKHYDSWPTLMIIGVILASLIGGAVMPYKPTPLVVLRSYSEIAGVPMDFFKYICFSLPVTFLIMLFYVVICRFVFRPDIKDLKNISADFADADAMTLNKKQKIALVFLFLFIAEMIAPSILPADWVLTNVINRLGIVGSLLILIIIMCWIRVEGQPMLEFQKMTKHINWDIFMVMTFVIPFSSIFTGDEVGIKEAIVQLLQPVLRNLSPIVFLVITLAIALVLTNFMNNMVVGAVFATLIYTIGSGIGTDVAPMIAVLIVSVNFAIVTPAASPLSAMTFANTTWCKPKDLFKYGIITVLLSFIFTIAVGLPWASIIY